MMTTSWYNSALIAFLSLMVWDVTGQPPTFNMSFSDPDSLCDMRNLQKALTAKRAFSNQAFPRLKEMAAVAFIVKENFLAHNIKRLRNEGTDSIMPAVDTVLADAISKRLIPQDVCLLVKDILYELAQIAYLNSLDPEVTTRIDLTRYPSSKEPGTYLFKNIEVLNLDKSKLSAIQNLSAANLKGLCLANNCLTLLPENIYGLKNLECLSCLNNHLASVPDALGDLTELVVLSLERNHLASVPDLSKLRNLVKLYLGGNKLTSIPGLNQLTKLEDLGVSDNKLSGELDVSALTQLRKFYGCKNRLAAINGLDNCMNLEVLDVSDNPIKKLAVIRSRRLKKLRLNNINLCTTPNMGYYQDLEELDLGNNRLDKLPGGIATLTKLRKLYLSNNKIETTVGLNKLENLEGLALDHNELTDIKGLLELKNLKQLNVSHNKIVTHPFDVSVVGKTLLMLGRRKPATIERLALNDNLLAGVLYVGLWTNLKMLLVHNNKLTEIKGLKRLPKLEVIRSSGNPLVAES